LLDFTDYQLKELKKCFDDLDEDKSGCIGVNEMTTPLIGLGFAKTIQDVQKMFDDVDDDKSGEIEFQEFLRIIKGSSATETASKTSKMTEFFQNMTCGKSSRNTDVSFSTFVNSTKRNSLMNSITSPRGSPSKIQGRELL
jgi:Ca2+-binding EF-hand superfamily protein